MAGSLSLLGRKVATTNAVEGRHAADSVDDDKIAACEFFFANFHTANVHDERDVCLRISRHHRECKRMLRQRWFDPLLGNRLGDRLTIVLNCVRAHNLRSAQLNLMLGYG